MDMFSGFIQVFTGLLLIAIFLSSLAMIVFFGWSVAKGRQLNISNIGIAILTYFLLIAAVGYVPYQFTQEVIVSMNKQAELQPQLDAAVRNLTAGVSEPFAPEMTATPYIIQTAPPIVATIEMPTFKPTPLPPTLEITPQATKDPCVWVVGQAPPNPNEGCD